MAKEPETRIEVIDGREFKVTVLPSGGIPKKRSHKTRYKMKDVYKEGNKTKIKEKDRFESKAKFPFTALINGKPVVIDGPKKKRPSRS